MRSHFELLWYIGSVSVQGIIKPEKKITKVHTYLRFMPTIYKGQLISKGLFDVIVWTKNQRNSLKDFCPSLKKSSNQKTLFYNYVK